MNKSKKPKKQSEATITAERMRAVFQEMVEHQTDEIIRTAERFGLAKTGSEEDARAVRIGLLAVTVCRARLMAQDLGDMGTAKRLSVIEAEKIDELVKNVTP